MPRNKAVDAYIKKSQPFAQPILNHLRDLVHEELPHAEEQLKWGMPAFITHGSILAHLGAFKEHAVFSFFKAPLLKDPKGYLTARGDSAMGHFGRLTSRKDLPADKVLRDFLRQADKLNETGAKVPKTAREKPTTPPFFKKALATNKKANANYKSLSASCQREYIDWLVEAKTEATRTRRVQTALEWISKGKTRNWKYER